MKSCKSCGCVNDNINRYCRNCGSLFQAEKISEPLVQPPQEEEVDALAVTPELPVTAADTPEQDTPEPAPAEPTAKDFFDLGSTSQPLFGEVEDTPAEELDYIDFDLGEPEEVSDLPPTVKGTPREAIKAVSRSALFVLLVLSALCLFAVNIAEAVIGSQELYSQVQSWLILLGFDTYGVYTVADYATLISFLIRFVAIFPAFLYSLGLLLVFAGSRSRGVGAQVGGLHCISAASVTGLISASTLVLLSGFFVTQYLLIGTYAGQETLSYATDGALLFAGVCLAGCVAVAYHCFALVSLSRLKHGLKGDGRNHRMSIFVMGINLTAALAGAAAVGFHLAGGEYLTFAVSLLQMLNPLLLTLVLLRCRVSLRNINEEV